MTLNGMLSCSVRKFAVSFRPWLAKQRGKNILKPCVSSAAAMILRLKSRVFIDFFLPAGTGPRDKLYYIVWDFV